MSTRTDEPRMYGGWRRSRGIGLLGLSTKGTLILLAVFTALIITTAVSPVMLVYLGPPVLAGCAAGLARPGGVPLATRVAQRVRWFTGTRRGWTHYRPDAILARTGTITLPGPLAATELLTAEDGYGGTYGLIRDTRTGYLTATFTVIPASTWLADRDDSDGWVAAWGGWLAALGHLPAIKWVSVTAATCPDPGATLSATLAAQADSHAPKAAREIIAQLAATAPATSAHAETTVSVTIDPASSPARPRTLQDAVAETGRILHGLQTRLGSCGVTVTGRAAPGQLTSIVRAAHDPHARRYLGEDETAPPDWENAGPGGAEEEWDRYRHAGAVSVSWAWREAPRSNVHSDVLARLTAPSGWAKRVTLQYRPFPAASAVRVLENEVRAAEFRQEYARRTKRDATARDAFDHARARQAAMEEAQGAGVTLASLYVTVTVEHPDDLARAVAATEAAAGSSKIQLQRLHGAQAAGFAVGLPCGIYLPDLVRRLR
jgi:hypothetical protein